MAEDLPEMCAAEKQRIRPTVPLSGRDVAHSLSRRRNFLLGHQQSGGGGVNEQRRYIGLRLIVSARLLFWTLCVLCSAV